MFYVYRKHSERIEDKLHVFLTEIVQVSRTGLGTEDTAAKCVLLSERMVGTPVTGHHRRAVAAEACGNTQAEYPFLSECQGGLASEVITLYLGSFNSAFFERS